MEVFYTVATILLMMPVIMANSVITTKYAYTRDDVDHLNLSCIAIQMHVYNGDTQCASVCRTYLSPCIGFGYQGSADTCMACTGSGLTLASHLPPPTPIFIMLGMFRLLCSFKTIRIKQRFEVEMLSWLRIKSVFCPYCVSVSLKIRKMGESQCLLAVKNLL